MDPRRNPYAPGDGTPPPELAGRDSLIEAASIALDRIRNRLAAKSLLMVGLRGVGKTVLLNRICHDAEHRGFITLPLEAPEDRSLPALLAGPLHGALLKMNRLAAAGDAARRALQALAGFVSSVRVDFGDLTQRLDMEKEPGLTDSGALDSDLSALLQAAGEAARSGSGSTGWHHRKNSICELWPRSAPALTVPAGSRRCSASPCVRSRRPARS